MRWNMCVYCKNYIPDIGFGYMQTIGLRGNQIDSKICIDCKLTDNKGIPEKFERRNKNGI